MDSASTADSSSVGEPAAPELPWRWRDTLALLGLFAWGAGWTWFSMIQLTDGPLLERRTALDLFCLSVGLASLYLALGIAALRMWEVLGSRKKLRD